MCVCVCVCVCGPVELLFIILHIFLQHCSIQVSTMVSFSDKTSKFVVITMFATVEVCTVLPREFIKRKGKAVPLQAWSGPEGASKLRFPDFMTTAQDGGRVVSLTHRPPLPPGNSPGTHFC